jgi:hypothetical protein
LGAKAPSWIGGFGLRARTDWSSLYVLKRVLTARMRDVRCNPQRCRRTCWQEQRAGPRNEVSGPAIEGLKDLLRGSVAGTGGAAAGTTAAELA